MTFQVAIFPPSTSPSPTPQAMFLSIVVGGSATLASTYILFSLAVLQFFVDTVKIILNKKRGEVEKLTENVQVIIGFLRRVLECVQALVLGETIEVFVPVCYAICFTLAYIGPNAKVMGNVSHVGF